MRAWSPDGQLHKGPGRRGTSRKHAPASGRPSSSAMPAVRNARRDDCDAGVAPRAAMAAQARPSGQQVQRHARQRLPIQARRQQQHQRHKGHHHGIAPAPDFQQLGRAHHQQQGAAGARVPAACERMPASPRTSVAAISRRSAVPGRRNRPSRNRLCHASAMPAAATHHRGNAIRMQQHADGECCQAPGTWPAWAAGCRMAPAIAWRSRAHPACRTAPAGTGIPVDAGRRCH